MMRKKSALITGVAGMDGSHLAEFLLEKDYHVYGVIKRNATRNLENAAHLENDIDIIEGDVTDMSSMLRIIQSCRPHELYNLAAQSHVHTSFEQPLASLSITANGIVNILECVKSLGYSTRIFHASTSEMFGSSPAPQSMETKFEPRSPYAIAKLAAHHFVKLYRDSYRMHASTGITFNHEGPRRGPLFVTRKISMGVAQCLKDPNFKLHLGNLQAKRDWGFAPDFVKGFYLAVQPECSGDYIFATGETHTVQEFCEKAFNYVGLNWEDHVECDRFFMRPSEVDELCGDFSKTTEQIGWQPEVTFEKLVEIMVDHDCSLLGVEKKK
jgi:GDPmannose 4,6-dehydratase